MYIYVWGCARLSFLLQSFIFFYSWTNTVKSCSFRKSLAGWSCKSSSFVQSVMVSLALSIPIWILGIAFQFLQKKLYKILISIAFAIESSSVFSRSLHLFCYRIVTWSNTGCRIASVRSAMTAVRSLQPLGADTIADCVGRYSAVVAVIKKSRENLWAIQVNAFYWQFYNF